MPRGIYERGHKPIKDRLLAKTVREAGDSACWEWTGSTGQFGHGQIGNGNHKPHLGTKRLLSTHRVAYELFVGEIPEGLFVLHECDNPCCVNPMHLFLGTAADNMNDMWSKGRGAHGERLPHTRLTEDDIRAIRGSHQTQAALAKTYGVSQGYISMIQTGIRRSMVV